MVLLADVCRLPDRAWDIVEAASVVVPAAGCWSAAHANPGGQRRRSSALSSGASLKAPPSCFAVPGRLVSSRPARGSAARASSARIGALELELRPRCSEVERLLPLERAVGCDRIAPFPTRRHSQVIWCSGRSWRRFRFLGFLNSRRTVRDDPCGRDGRRTRRRTTAVPLPGLAEASRCRSYGAFRARYLGRARGTGLCMVRQA